MKNLTFGGAKKFQGPQGGREVQFQNREKCPWAIRRRTRIPNFNPIGGCKRGEKSGEPKTGEKKREGKKSGGKILVLDAKCA